MRLSLISLPRMNDITNDYLDISLLGTYNINVRRTAEENVKTQPNKLFVALLNLNSLLIATDCRCEFVSRWHFLCHWQANDFPAWVPDPYLITCNQRCWYTCAWCFHRNWNKLGTKESSKKIDWHTLWMSFYSSWSLEKEDDEMGKKELGTHLPLFFSRIFIHSHKFSPII